MKHFSKLLASLAVLTIFSVAFIGCNNPSSTNEGPVVEIATYTGTQGNFSFEFIFYSNKTFLVNMYNTETNAGGQKEKGTYSGNLNTNGATITFRITHEAASGRAGNDWVASSYTKTGTVSDDGNTLTRDWAGDLILTRQ